MAAEARKAEAAKQAVTNRHAGLKKLPPTTIEKMNGMGRAVFNEKDIKLEHCRVLAVEHGALTTLLNYTSTPERSYGVDFPTHTCLLMCQIDASSKLNKGKKGSSLTTLGGQNFYIITEKTKIDTWLEFKSDRSVFNVAGRVYYVPRSVHPWYLYLETAEDSPLNE